MQLYYMLAYPISLSLAYNEGSWYFNFQGVLSLIYQSFTLTAGKEMDVIKMVYCSLVDFEGIEQVICKMQTFFRLFQFSLGAQINV